MQTHENGAESAISEPQERFHWNCTSDLPVAALDSSITYLDQNPQGAIGICLTDSENRPPQGPQQERGRAVMYCKIDPGGNFLVT